MKPEHTVFFDGVDVRSLGLIFLTEHSNPIIPGTRDKTSIIDGVNGEYDYGADLEPIPFDLPFFIEQTDPFRLQGYVRMVKKLLLDGFGKPRTFKLQFGYEKDKYYNVRVVGRVDIDRIYSSAGHFTLPLMCYEGYALSVARNDEVVWGSQDITFTADYLFGNNGSGAKTFTSNSSTVVTVTGDNLRPLIKLSGSGTNVKLSWGGKTMTLGTFTNANWLIDLEDYTVTKNGNLGLDLIKGDWLDMYLSNGDNNINVEGSGLNLAFSVEFRDRFS
ncbi:phage tail family protein [Ureibacillus sp. Re31]|uniref:Phage tail family protein n=1 Tax=Ureibacillus galli TaxID=2762222 RepID=A0ABR8XG08_9BACL|nr:phage tail domain-containing protein [Ureibacillus galli]MBD8028143.1 phage tail family protein [Ureibacillus galli]